MKRNALVMLVASALMMSSVSYAKNDDHQGNDRLLPPGLQKNQERGKPLPPGWQKKISRGDVLERDIYQRGRVITPRDKDGKISIIVDGTVIRLIENTREIIEILSH